MKGWFRPGSAASCPLPASAPPSSWRCWSAPRSVSRIGKQSGYPGRWSGWRHFRRRRRGCSWGRASAASPIGTNFNALRLDQWIVCCIEQKYDQRYGTESTQKDPTRRKVLTNKVLKYSLGGPDSPPQAYGIENIALAGVVRLGWFRFG